MPDTFPATLQTWQTFYFMVGGAAASLTGLMFITVSLATGMIDGHLYKDNYKISTAPSIFYFVTVLIASGIMLIPMKTPLLAGIGVLVGGVIGIGVTLMHARRIIRVSKGVPDINVDDWLAQVIVPVASYVLLVFTALAFIVERWDLALDGLCLATLLLLTSAIANTWSLVVWLIRNRATP